MRRTRSSFLGLPLWILAGLVIAPAAPRFAPEEDPVVVVGELAPDFALPRLSFRENDAGERVGVIDEGKRLELSALRGKRPVCLVMSSYT